MPNEVSRSNDGPFDKRIFPPKWAFDPISEEDYQKQKNEYEAGEWNETDTRTKENESALSGLTEHY